MGKINFKTAFLCLSISLVLVGISGVLLFLFSGTFQSVYNDIAGNVRLEEIVQNNDIFNASLLLAQEYYQGIDIEQANKTFDKIANEIKVRIDDIDKPKKIIGIINDYLFVDCQIQPCGKIVIENMLVDKVLENKKGTAQDYPCYILLSQKGWICLCSPRLFLRTFMSVMMTALQNSTLKRQRRESVIQTAIIPIIFLILQSIKQLTNLVSVKYWDCF